MLELKRIAIDQVKIEVLIKEGISSLCLYDEASKSDLKLGTLNFSSIFVQPLVMKIWLRTGKEYHNYTKFQRNIENILQIQEWYYLSNLILLRSFEALKVMETIC